MKDKTTDPATTQINCISIMPTAPTKPLSVKGYNDNDSCTFQDCVYLDNAAASVPDLYACTLTENYFNWINPNALYAPARKYNEQIEQARAKCARAINADPEQIIFTSCASESNATIISNFETVVCSKYEHKSVLKHPNIYGEFKDYDDLEEAIQGIIDFYLPHPLISCMMVQNETGEIFPIKDYAEMAHQHSIPFHSDASQAFGKVDIDAKELDIDFMTISSQKINAPRGCSVLYVKHPELLKPLISGTQENGLRGGTQNIGAILATGYAMERYKYIPLYKGFFSNLCHNFVHTLNLNLVDTGIRFIVGDTEIPTGNPSTNAILNVAFKDLDAETIVLTASTFGLYISAGSACDSKIKKIGVSPAIARLDLPQDYENSVVRISFSHLTDISDVIKGAEILSRVVKLLYDV